MTVEIVMARYDGPGFRLAFESESEFADDVRMATDDDLSLEDVANFLDQHAESCNAHDYVPAHRAIAAVMLSEIGREAATRVMIRLAEFGGLAGIMGMDSLDVQDDFEAAYVQVSDWSNWSLPAENDPVA